MKYSLKAKLSLSYIFVALICVALISYLTNFLLDKQFQEYVKQNQEQKNKEVVATITQQYQSNAKWNKDIIENIGVAALENGLIIKIKDAEGKVIWDATVHNNGMCQKIIQQMATNMNSHYAGLKGGYAEKTYPVTYQFAKIGDVDIGYYGPFYLSENDLEFISTLNKFLVGVGVFSLLFAFVLGSVMAKRLSTPIARVIGTAQMISKGYFNDRIAERSSTKEICLLTETINNLAQTLENQEALRKRLTADVAHELRTPIATLQSHMEAMIDGIWEADTERLKSCHDEIIRINRMVGDLEKLARYESENLVLNKTEFDVSELIQNLLKNFETDFANKGIKISFRGKIEKITADKDKMSQVLINLVSNAIKYTPKGGTVEVKAIGSSNETEIRIRDTGMGIPSEDLPHIFERFYRADKSRNRMTGGSGIGLAIVKVIMDAHKGNIMVQSELNKGSEFIVTLPKQVG